MTRTLLVLLLFLYGCSSPTYHVEKGQLFHDASMRTFYILEPSRFHGSMTLVIGLHGYTGSAKTFIRDGEANFNNFLEKREDVRYTLLEKASFFLRSRDELANLIFFFIKFLKCLLLTK